MIIGITGGRGHGKSTAANVLKKEFGFIEYSFAEPLKEICKQMFGLSDAQVYGDYEVKDKIDERLGVSPREILQKFGTNFGRQYLHEILPNLKVPKGEFWLQTFKWWYEQHENQDIVLKKLESPETYVLRRQELKVVIADVRFLNEAKIIKDLGGIIIRVYRPELKLEESNHVSETEMKEIEHDYYVVSNENIEDFREQIRKLYKKIQEPFVVMKIDK